MLILKFSAATHELIEFTMFDILSVVGVEKVYDD